MTKKLLNSSVIIGAILFSVSLPGIFFACATPMMPLFLIVAGRGLYAPRSVVDDLIELGIVAGMIALVAALLLCPVIAGWFVARSVIRRASKEKGQTSARFAALCGMTTALVGVSPYVLLYIIFTLRVFPIAPGWTLNLDPNVFLEAATALVIFGALGALGGALYYWLQGSRLRLSGLA